MGLTASERRARFVFLLDLILAGTPVTFYLIMLLILSVLWIFGEYNAAYSVLDWIFQSVMFVPKPMYGTPTNPGQVADLRMFFFSVWGIALLYNIVDIFMSLYLLKSMRMRYEDPFLLWMGVRILIIVTTTVFIIVQLAFGFSFLSQLLAILYLIYRCLGFAIILRRLRAMRDGLEQDISP